MKLNKQLLTKQLKAHLAGDGNLWGRMASSHPGAQGVDKSFIELAEYLRSIGVSADSVEEYLNNLSEDD